MYGDRSTPKYLQLKEIIKRYLKNQRYQTGPKTPSELDGLIIEPSGGVTNYLGSPNFHNRKSLPFPVVFMAWELDDREGGFRATRYLIEAGHRRIACIFTNAHISGLARYDG